MLIFEFFHISFFLVYQVPDSRGLPLSMRVVRRRVNSSPRRRLSDLPRVSVLLLLLTVFFKFFFSPFLFVLGIPGGRPFL